MIPIDVGHITVAMDHKLRYQGLCVRYFAGTNVICEVCFYVDDVLHGDCKYYYDNDKLKYHRKYKNGFLHGECYSYDMAGNIESAVIFYHGKILYADPRDLSEKDKLYVMMSGRLPPRDSSC